MSVLSFRCVVTQIANDTETSRRRTWIESEDFPGLALAATREIGSTPQACGYTLFMPEVSRSGVFLEVVHEGASALVGPMSGPRPSPELAADRFYGFDEFLGRVGFASDPMAGAGGRDGSTRLPLPGMYPVTVRFAGIWNRDPTPVVSPARDDRESSEAYRRRRETAEDRRIARARHEGLHVVSYPVPAPTWRAWDLERLMELAYALLPTSEPRWRQSGAITQDPRPEAADLILPPLTAGGGGALSRRGRRRRRPPLRFCLEVGRGEYVAALRLPRFPTWALVEWLERRPCEIALCYAVDRLAQPPRPLAKDESVHVDSLM